MNYCERELQTKAPHCPITEKRLGSIRALLEEVLLVAPEPVPSSGLAAACRRGRSPGYGYFPATANVFDLSKYR